jgi:hypothetical protein
MHLCGCMCVRVPVGTREVLFKYCLDESTSDEVNAHVSLSVASEMCACVRL